MTIEETHFETGITAPTRETTTADPQPGAIQSAALKDGEFRFESGTAWIGPAGGLRGRVQTSQEGFVPPRPTARTEADL